PWVPGSFTVVPELPRTATGKVDRKQLAAARPAAAPTAPPPGAGDAPAESEVARAIAAVWREGLGGPGGGRRDSVFDLGGHSLRVVRAQERLQEVLGREIALVDLFRHPTVETLAAFLAPPPAEPPTAPMPQRPAETGQGAGREIAIVGLACRLP